MLIDTSFDFRTDASGKDPDAYSPTLRLYHKLLWSKALPSGQLFDLDDTVRGMYLHHGSELGEFFLSSDSVMATFTKCRSRHSSGPVDDSRRLSQPYKSLEHRGIRVPR